MEGSCYRATRARRGGEGQELIRGRAGEKDQKQIREMGEEKDQKLIRGWVRIKGQKLIRREGLERRVARGTRNGGREGVEK